LGDRRAQSASEVRSSFAPVKTLACKGTALRFDLRRLYSELFAELAPMGREVEIASLRDQQFVQDSWASRANYDPRNTNPNRWWNSEKA
jgi:hypothetical protein